MEDSDPAIGCTADCSSCTSLITHGSVQFEHKGKPTEIIASSRFKPDIEASTGGSPCRNFHSTSSFPMYNNLDEAQAIAQTVPVLHEVISKLRLRRDDRSGQFDGKRDGSSTYRAPTTSTR